MQESQGKKEIDGLGEECRHETFEPCHAERKSVEAEEMKIDPSKNTIVCGDNLKWLNDIPDESVDLCYTDPPFFSNATYEKVWGNGWEVTSFGDRFAGGINHYIEWMRPRIQLIHKKLKANGIIFLHCDWHASHRLRCLLDEEFKDENFLNEIVWCYRSGGASKNHFSQKHDLIYAYKKTSKAKLYLNKEEKSYQAKGSGKNPAQTYYEDENGVYTLVYPKDWWEIGMLATSSKERIGYRTQKPKELIHKIISLASKEGDIILDCFAGGFTTAEVCVDLKRKFICGDVSPVACKVGSKRLNKSNFFEYEIKGMYQTEEEFRNMSGHDFAESICDLMGWKCNEKKSNDKGIDGWDGNNNPIQIKNQRSKTGEKDLRNFWGTLQAANKTTGIFVAWDFTPEGVDFVAKHKNEVQIELRKCRDLIGDLLIANEKRQQIEQFYAEKVPEDWVETPLNKSIKSG